MREALGWLFRVSRLPTDSLATRPFATGCKAFMSWEIADSEKLLSLSLVSFSSILACSSFFYFLLSRISFSLASIILLSLARIILFFIFVANALHLTTVIIINLFFLACFLAASRLINLYRVYASELALALRSC
jgi:hypothetical protein